MSEQRRWDEVQLAFYVPDEVQKLAGRTPVYSAGKVEGYRESGVLVFGVLIALLAVIMLGMALLEKAGWGWMLSRAGAGLLLGWAAWKLLSYWWRKRNLREACDREYRDQGNYCDARVVFAEMRNPRDDSPDFFLYYQFRDDFIIQELLDDRNSRKSAEVGDTVTISYLRRDPRIARIATWK